MQPETVITAEALSAYDKICAMFSANLLVMATNIATSRAKDGVRVTKDDIAEVVPPEMLFDADTVVSQDWLRQAGFPAVYAGNNAYRVVLPANTFNAAELSFPYGSTRTDVRRLLAALKLPTSQTGLKLLC